MACPSVSCEGRLIAILQIFVLSKKKTCRYRQVLNIFSQYISTGLRHGISFVKPPPIDQYIVRMFHFLTLKRQR